MATCICKVKLADSAAVQREGAGPVCWVWHTFMCKTDRQRLAQGQPVMIYMLQIFRDCHNASIDWT